MYQSGNAVSASDQLRYHGHWKSSVSQLANRLITALQIGLAAPAAWDIPNTLFPFSFNAVFTTQCVAVLAWLWIVNPQNNWFFF